MVDLGLGLAGAWIWLGGRFRTVQTRIVCAPRFKRCRTSHRVPSPNIYRAATGDAWLISGPKYNGAIGTKSGRQITVVVRVDRKYMKELMRIDVMKPADQSV